MSSTRFVQGRAVAREGIGGVRHPPPPNFYKIAQFGIFFNPIRKVWRQAYFKKIIHFNIYAHIT